MSGGLWKIDRVIHPGVVWKSKDRAGDAFAFRRADVRPIHRPGSSSDLPEAALQAVRRSDSLPLDGRSKHIRHSRSSFPRHFRRRFFDLPALLPGLDAMGALTSCGSSKGHRAFAHACSAVTFLGPPLDVLFIFCLTALAFFRGGARFSMLRSSSDRVVPLSRISHRQTNDTGSVHSLFAHQMTPPAQEMPCPRDREGAS